MYVHVLHFKWRSSWFSCTESCGLLIARLVLMGFIQILAFLWWGCSAPWWFQLPCVFGGVSQPGTKCPARPPAELLPSLGQCGGLWLSLAAQTFVCLSPKSTSGAAVGACMVLLFVGEQQYVKHQSCCRQQRVRGESVLEAASKFTRSFSYFSLLCIASHSCTRIIYSSQRQLIWTKKLLLEAKCIFCLHYPDQTGEKKMKAGRQGEPDQGKSWKQKPGLPSVFCPWSFVLKGVVGWIQKENKGQSRNDLNLIFSKPGSFGLQSCGSALLVRRQNQD